MRSEVKIQLLNNYYALPYKGSITAIKYGFKYHNVNVNLYFDAYDEKNPSLSMILSFSEKYYYTSLNVKDTSLRKEYLEKLPPVILKQLLNTGKHLDAFFEEIDNHILSASFTVINYKRDIMFTNTMKYSRKRSDLPFLHTIKKVRMSDDTLNSLSATMGIKKDILLKIQRENMTLVRTADPDKRKNLIAILQGSIVEI